jgi:hypothetical protein
LGLFVCEVMKKPTIVLIVLLCVGVICCGGTFMCGKAAISNYEEIQTEGGKFATSFVKTFCQDLDIAKAKTMIIDEFKGSELDNLANLLKDSYGKLTELSEPAGDGFKSFAGTAGSYAIAVFVYDAKFDKGTARIRVTMLKRNGKLQVQAFRISAIKPYK